jgi:hypothetical protein
MQAAEQEMAQQDQSVAIKGPKSARHALCADSKKNTPPACLETSCAIVTALDDVPRLPRYHNSGKTGDDAVLR